MSAAPGAPGEVVELIGVYHADGGPLGEAKYVIGRLLGTAHCALCDITHSPVRRKPAWDAAVARLGLPMTLLHLNEMPADVAAAVRVHGSPLLLGRTGSGGLIALLGPAHLERLGGSVDRFEAAAQQARRSTPAIGGPPAPDAG